MSEHTPLLEPTPPSVEQPGSSQQDEQDESVLEHLPTLSVCIILIILLDFGIFLATIPLNQVLEQNICQALHPGVFLSPNDPICKEKAVQSELSLVRGWQGTFDFIPGLLVAVPYGRLADKAGRKFVLTLSSIGITLGSCFYVVVCAFPGVFPPRLTWLSSIFGFIGGGAPVINAMIFTITGDITTEESRATTFFYLGAAALAGELLSGPTLYLLMEVNIWLPILLGVVCLGIGTILTQFVPDTLSGDEAAVEDSGDVEADRTRASPACKNDKISRLVRAAQSEVSKLGKAATFFTKRHFHIVALLLTLLFTTFGRFAQELLAQYVTKRYHWTWAESSFLLSIRAFFTLILLLVGLPFASYLLVTKLSLSGHVKDIWLARASGLLLTMGAFAIGIAAQPVLMIAGLALLSLGSGYTLLVRSLLAAAVHKNQVATMYTIIGVVETVGVLISGPLLAVTFRIGIEKDGGWLGLPYLVAGLLFAIATATVVGIRASRLDQSPREILEEEE